MTLRLSLALAATLLSTAALAHSKKEGTTPADGARIAETPEVIQMAFDDPMRITLIRLVDGSGAEMPLDRVTGLEPTREFTAEPSTVLAPGSYTVEWRGLASDGHAMQGSFSFELAN